MWRWMMPANWARLFGYLAGEDHTELDGALKGREFGPAVASSR
jgi:hypothetical protein